MKNLSFFGTYNEQDEVMVMGEWKDDEKQQKQIEK